MSESMTRADAERILAAHGLELADLGWTEVCFCRNAFASDRPPFSMPISLLRALDPDRPPTLAQLRRLQLGLDRMPKYCELQATIEARYGTDEEAEALLARAWEIGKEDGA